MKYFLTLLIFLSSCYTNKAYKTALKELNDKYYIKVPLQELLQKKEKYHGQFVETSGYFHFGFEESAIYYNMIATGDTTIKYRDYCGLWVEFNHNHPYYYNYPDSLNSKLIIVKGYFDTTKIGHVGGCYRAGLMNTCDLKISNKEF